MKTVWNEIKVLFKQKAYVICIIFVAIMTYGSLVLNPTIGIDDTAWKIYFIDCLWMLPVFASRASCKALSDVDDVLGWIGVYCSCVWI